MTPARARMTAGQRREMVLQAALIEFAARGLDGTSTQDIARRAGISHAYLFRLFPAKKALFLTLVPRCFQQVAQALATAAAGHTGEDALQAMGSAFGRLCQQRTLPLMQLHAYAAATDPDIGAATWAAFSELRGSVERLTGLPPARVQRWLGTAMLMTATTAMDLHGKKPHMGLAGQACASACGLTAPVIPQADVIPGGAAGAGGTSPDRGPTRSAALKGTLEGVATSQKGRSHA